MKSNTIFSKMLLLVGNSTGTESVSRWSIHCFSQNPDENRNEITKSRTNENEKSIDPRFSPSGEWILFRQETNKMERVSNFYLIRPDGTDEILTANGRWNLIGRPASLNMAWFPVLE
jgi:hypothetical protein